MGMSTVELAKSRQLLQQLLAVFLGGHTRESRNNRDMSDVLDRKEDVQLRTGTCHWRPVGLTVLPAVTRGDLACHDNA